MPGQIDRAGGRASLACRHRDVGLIRIAVPDSRRLLAEPGWAAKHWQRPALHGE
jgi:hypothetical protein